MDLISRLLACPKYILPSSIHSALFLLEEAGEVASELSRTLTQYARSNGRQFDSHKLGLELADVVIICYAMAKACKIDLDQAIEEKTGILEKRYGGVNDESQ